MTLKAKVVSINPTIVKEINKYPEPNHLDYKHKNKWNELVFRSDYDKSLYADNWEIWQQAEQSRKTYQVVKEDESEVEKLANDYSEKFWKEVRGVPDVELKTIDDAIRSTSLAFREGYTAALNSPKGRCWREVDWEKIDVDFEFSEYGEMFSNTEPICKWFEGAVNKQLDEQSASALRKFKVEEDDDVERLIIKLQSLQPDFDTKQSYQHGFFDGIGNAIKWILDHPSKEKYRFTLEQVTGFARWTHTEFILIDDAERIYYKGEKRALEELLELYIQSLHHTLKVGDEVEITDIDNEKLTCKIVKS